MTTRDDRLRADFEALKSLKAASDILEFEAAGEAPERYTIVFRGKGVGREAAGPDMVEFVEVHKVDIRLPYSYPERPPDIRWLTPILHPNVSFSGFIDLAEVGLPWHDDDLGLDAICERLWDMARLAYVNPEKASNYAARNWYEKECRLSLPVDARPLRNRAGHRSTNVIRYQRRGQAPPAATGASREVLFIGEDTPTPVLPAASAPPPFPVPRRVRRDGDDDVLYIE